MMLSCPGCQCHVCIQSACMCLCTCLYMGGQGDRLKSVFNLIGVLDSKSIHCFLSVVIIYSWQRNNQISHKLLILPFHHCMVSATPIIPPMITSLQIFSIPTVNSIWTHAFAETKIWHQKGIKRRAVNDQDSSSACFSCFLNSKPWKVILVKQPSTEDGENSSYSHS